MLDVIRMLFPTRAEHESLKEQLAAANKANVKLSVRIKKLEHDLQVQRARTGDQKSIVRMLKARLAEFNDVADPVKAILQEQNAAAQQKQKVLRAKREATKQRIRQMASVEAARKESEAAEIGKQMGNGG